MSIRPPQSSISQSSRNVRLVFTSVFGSHHNRARVCATSQACDRLAGSPCADQYRGPQRGAPTVIRTTTTTAALRTASALFRVTPTTSSLRRRARCPTVAVSPSTNGESNSTEGEGDGAASANLPVTDEYPGNVPCGCETR
jgi:hypothetical protein